ncbi:class D sortase [Peristeroidobacter agariperforans]|uniref:class D sortase n=1 Tax=Peristeroidobacter agariperforans TaxID=268404 RepID=UPI00101C3EF8|nr:class D sortase [Peristeroidobacter agariperforans]
MRSLSVGAVIVALLLSAVALSGATAIEHADTVADHVVDMSSWSATRIAAYRNRAPLKQKPEAILRIPSIGLVVPVFAGTSPEILDQAAGRIERTSPFGASGNTGIAAHRDGFFRALRNVKVGDVLQVDLPDATVSYRIVSTRIVDPSETGVLRATTEPTITLVTCYPFYFAGSAPQRFIVRATRAPNAEDIRLSRAHG